MARNMLSVVFLAAFLVLFVNANGHGGGEGGGQGGGEGGDGGGEGGWGHHEPCNLTTAWQRCVNHTEPCPCYAQACPQNVGNNIPGESLTIEKAMVLEYNRILVERTYQDAWFLFAPDIQVNVPYFDISFSGAGVNVAYLYLGDPEISDTYNILDSQVDLLLQQGLTVFARINITYQNLHTLVIWQTTNLWVFTFAENHTVIQEDIYIDSLGTYDILYATGTLNLDVPTLCEDIMRDCVGANLQYGGSIPTCEAFMYSVPTDIFGLVATGDSVECRSWHEVLARSDPNVHCEHTGPLKLNPINTPCNNF